MLYFNSTNGLKETKTDHYAELSQLGIADGHNYKG